MKIYFVVKEPSERTINHFVSSLGNALQKQGCEVSYGLKLLWTDEVLGYDIIHFQWPEGLFGLFGHQVLKRVNQRLVWLKEHGKRIFYTCHNLKPHTNKNENLLCLYELICNHADYVHHLGNYSCELFQSQYPNACHVVIPHHIYDNVLSFSVSRQEARQRLHLPQDKKIILSFGKFRNDKERNFVLSLKEKIEVQPSAAEALRATPSKERNSVLFLMPGFYRQTLHTWNPKKLVPRLYHTLCYRLKGIQFSNEVIPDDMMQYYFCAADVVLIQRLDILNSGNLPMAFHAGKVVVGPEVGNVGEILRQTGNYFFNPKSMNTAADSLHKALNDTGKGEENYEYAMKYWSANIIASKLLESYEDLKKNKTMVD